MASVSVVDKQGNEKEKLKISDELVKTDTSEEIIYQDIRRYLAQIRAGTHSTKGRSEVRGGGRKPWRQKGTGNARAGTIRSPLWKGGRKSKAIALSEKFRNGKLIVVDDLGLKEVSTKKAAKIIEDLKVANKKILLVTDNLNDNDSKSFRNINNVVVESAKGVNAYYLMFADYVIFTKNSLNKLIERMTDGKSKS